MLFWSLWPNSVILSGLRVSWLSDGKLRSWMFCWRTSVSLCVPGWKNWKGPRNMRPLRRAPSRCDITLLTPLFFSVCTRDILQEKWKKKNISASTAIITISAVLLVQLLLHVLQHFFTYLFLPLTWFWSESGNSYGTINYKGRGGGVQNICFLAFFALFHGLLCLFWIRRGFGWRRKRTRDISEEVCHTWGPEETWIKAAAEDLRG